MNWLTGGALVMCLAMVVGLLAMIVVQGVTTFWPGPIVRIKTVDGRTLLGEIVKTETYRPEEPVLARLPASAREEAAQHGGFIRRRLVRTGNFELTGEHFRWVDDASIVETASPADALLLEREAWGRFYGTPKELRVKGVVTASGSECFDRFAELHATVRVRVDKRRRLETGATGDVNRELETWDPLESTCRHASLSIL